MCKLNTQFDGGVIRQMTEKLEPFRSFEEHMARSQGFKP
ncbi:conserved hypothetical protein [Bacillus altitudinis]|uniref:Uncharacterized protein n=1 Tax=Bacillus altitudinis TaxID=293387 RepID=A0A653SPX5_BACAB|nr:hypothetical protein US8_02979 [Bacillus altitudinis]VXB70455.1 conserved hypothetical protein [Bacillus altitudinis]